MSKIVDTISYWMPILRKIKEFQEIAKTEDIELNLIYEEVERILNNMFIETSDEYGISRLEKIIGIVPDVENTLETRRLKVLSRWNYRVPYTDRELYNKLLSLCGTGNFTIIENYKEYILDIITNIGIAGGFDEACRILMLMMPCNLVVTISNELDEVGVNVSSYGIGISTSMHYTVTNDLQVTNKISSNTVVSNVVSTGTSILTN